MAHLYHDGKAGAGLQILLGPPYTKATDMWSLGCVAAFLYPGRSEYGMMKYIVETQGHPEDSLLTLGQKTAVSGNSRQRPGDMAVANFQYITRMSSGFKVYILEGQPHLRSEDRYRHIANDRARVPTVFPVKRKRSHERGLTLEDRRERALSRSSGKASQRAAPAVFHRPQSPTSTWSPTPSPTSPLPPHMYYAPVMDEPLALIKKPRKDPESTEEKTKSSAPTQTQMRPSVITCVSSSRNPSCRSEIHRSPSSDATMTTVLRSIFRGASE
ncbi:Homeodomain-interacting protein kinase 2 [Liparis tanakae]|uniref:Homeodomain-interacting protein kinase 2 n=1 Tax=Liparis tanakae TaxID=230148 RepID=A0A4Z2J825_9TELE|nr:Homeodomain-interacting protein kinase 2 [Liparis tanakae]